MNQFAAALKSTLDNEIDVTENGAIGFKTSGKKLLDLNFATSGLRKASKEDIEKYFSAAFYESPLLAVKWLFFARDVRGGMGERRIFRICFAWMANVKPELVKKLLPLVATYGRFDDILNCGLTGDIWNEVIKYIDTQISADYAAYKEEKPFSLLAKWLPSVNTSSPKTRALAKSIARSLNLSERQYRKMLSALRSSLKVIEVSTSANEWSKIDYNAVPSQANLKYKNAFLKHDEARRRKFLADLSDPSSGAKINAGAAFPCDIVSKYKSCYHSIGALDAALEGMWKALPDFVAGNDAGKTIVVADGSGSMYTPVSGQMTALDVANSLAVYFAEKLTGPFKNKYITFSMKPQLVDFSNASSLKEKLEIALKHDECANTNVEAVFDLILDTAVQNKLSQSELPANVLIVSDMAFDRCACRTSVPVNNYGSYYSCYTYKAADAALFTQIANRYAAAGYKLPRLVFWNVASGAKGAIPVQKNNAGVALVSGYSPAIAKMVFSAKTDPFEVLLDMLNVPRYQAIEDAAKGLL